MFFYVNFYNSMVYPPPPHHISIPGYNSTMTSPYIHKALFSVNFMYNITLCLSSVLVKLKIQNSGAAHIMIYITVAKFIVPDWRIKSTMA